MSLIQYEYDGEQLYVYSDGVDNQLLLDEIIKSEWKYMVDMNVYYNNGKCLKLKDYASTHFTPEQNKILQKYMFEGLEKMMNYIGYHNKTKSLDLSIKKISDKIKNIEKYIIDDSKINNNVTINGNVHNLNVCS